MVLKLFLAGETRATFDEWLSWRWRLWSKRFMRDEGRYYPVFTKERKEHSPPMSGVFRIRFTIGFESPGMKWGKGVRWEDVPNDVQLFVDFWPIHFDIGPDTSRGINIFAECSDLDFEDYFLWLLAAIADNWDEVHEQLAEQGIKLAADSAYSVEATDHTLMNMQQSDADVAQDKPWMKIADHAWDRCALELWWGGYTAAEIAYRIPAVGAKTVLNRLSVLRKTYGTDIVPTNDQRKKMQ